MTDRALRPVTGIRTEVRDALGDLAPEWDALVDASPRPSPYLRSWWVESVAIGTPTFVLVFDDGDLIGGAPLAEDRGRGVRRYRLVTSGPEAGLDLVADPSRRDAVTHAVGQWLDRPGSRIVDLSGIRPDGELARCRPRTARVEALETAPWFTLPATFDAYLASRRKKLRQEVRRVLRRFGELGARYGIVAPGDTDRALATLEGFHRKRWGEHSVLVGTFDRFAAAVRLGVPRGEVFVHEVDVGGEVIASLVTVERWGTCFFHQMGRNPAPRWSNSGTFLKAKAIERACVAGFARVDLCYGDPPDKVIWADERAPVVRVHWGRGAAGRVVHGALSIVRPAVDTLRRRRRTSADRERRADRLGKGDESAW